MKASKFPVRPLKSELLRVSVTEAEKQRLFELAASRDKTASQLIRDAIAATFFTEKQAA